MRIISNFRDYYDSVSSHTDDLVFQRHTMENNILPVELKLPTSTNYNLPSEVSIIFCNKLYRAVYNFNRREIFYSIEEMDGFVEATYNKKEKEYYYRKEGWYSKYGMFRRSVQEEYFEKAKNITVKCDYPIVVGSFTMAEKYRKYITYKNKYIESINSRGNPNLLYENEFVLVNPRLSDYSFQRIVPPYAAFQEISMFIGNSRKAEKPIPPISNADMINAKGFDKWSFRKEPK